ATANDADGSVSSVTFFANDVPIASDTTSPFAIDWTPSASGAYSLKAVATDNVGATTTSATVQVTVTVSTPAGRTNVALAANGGTATASSIYGSGFAPSSAINGDRKGQPWGNGGAWNDATG